MEEFYKISNDILSDWRRNKFDNEESQILLREYVEKCLNIPSISIPDFVPNLQWMNTTRPLSLYEDLKGKLTLLDFFTYCCINCMHILPDLKLLEEEFPITDGLVVIGVHCAKFTNEKETANIVSAVQRYEIKHPVVNDCRNDVWGNLDVNCWPTMILIGPSGQPMLALRGEGHLEILRLFVRETLRQMDELKLLSRNPLRGVEVTNDLKRFGRHLRFPGKIKGCPGVDLLAISDTGHNRVLLLSSDGRVKHVIGGLERGFADGNFETAKFNAPQGSCFLSENRLLVADTENHAIRSINISEGSVSTLVGNGKKGDDRIGGKGDGSQEISSPWDVAYAPDSHAHVAWIAMAGVHQIWALFLEDGKLWKSDPKTYAKGTCLAVAGSGREENRNNCYPRCAGFAQPSELSYNARDQCLYVADSESSTIRQMSLVNGKVANVVGGNADPANLFAFGDEDGRGTSAKLQHPLGVAFSTKGRNVYVADSYNHKIKIIPLETSAAKAEIRTIPLMENGVLYRFNEPGGLCEANGRLYIADTNNHSIKVYGIPEEGGSDGNNEIAEFAVKMPREEITAVAAAAEVDQEVTIFMKKGAPGKGVISVRMFISKPENVTLSPNSPSFWYIDLPGDWKAVNPGLMMQQPFTFDGGFALNAPTRLEEEVEIHVRGQAYLCGHSTCILKRVTFSLIVKPREDAPSTEASCEFTHNFVL